MPPRWSRHLWWILSIASLLSLASWVIQTPEFLTDWVPVLIATALTAILIHFRFPLGEIQVNLAHAISLTMGVALNPGAAGFTFTVGLALGELIYGAIQQLPKMRQERQWLELKVRSLEYSRYALSIFGGLTVYKLLGGASILETLTLPGLLPSLGLALGFTLLFLALHWLTRLLLESRRPNRRETITLLLVAILPIPFAITVAAAYANLGPLTLFILGGVTAIISPILRNLSLAEQDLQKRLQELSTLSRVSHAMRTTLDMQDLLTTIYLQVAHLLQVDNFYVALLENDSLTYPLAVKDGRREDWPDRTLSDRLTERVIFSTAPLLLSERAPETLKEMGLPELENAPQAWLGVPLSNPESTFGCLAVFHSDLDKRFTEKDREILGTIAGQAAVAIENAALYQQTSQRAQALGLLNEITAVLSSTLDPEKALELVSQSMIRVGGGQKSAIYLLDPDRRQLFLARATNLSDHLIQESMTIPLDDPERATPSREGSPVFVSDLDEADLSLQLKSLYQAEGIQAYAEFPLSTPQGTIGQLAVYFSSPKHFLSDEIELLKTFASQAGLAVANARVHAETDMALRRRIAQLSTLESIGREMITTLDLDELFEIILDHALRLTNAEIGHLVVYEPESDGLRVAAHRGCAPDSRSGQIGRIVPIGEGAVGRAFRTAVPQVISDTLLETYHTDWSGVDARSIVSVPITRRGTSMGVITIESVDPSAFWSEHEQFLSQLSAQAAIALSNASLYKELEEHLREQALLYQAGKEIAATLNPMDVARAIIDNFTASLSTEEANLYRWDPLKEMFHQYTMMMPSEDEAPFGRSLSVEEVPAFAIAIEQRDPVQWTQDSAPSPQDQAYIQSRHAQSVLAIPLVAGEEPLGLVEILSPTEQVFNQRELRTARTIASQAAVALKNTDLFKQIQANHESLLAVLNSTQEGILMADPSGKVVIANHKIEELTGISLSDLMGKMLTDADVILPQQLGYSSQELVDRIASWSDPQIAELASAGYVLESPLHRYLQRAESPVLDSDGKLIGWLIVLRDVSKERELNEARKQLTEMIVHDLRSPLNTVLNSFRLLDPSGILPEKAQVFSQALSIAERSSIQMLGLVNSLLDIAKLEAGELQISRSEISIQKLFDELMMVNIHAANEQGIVLDCVIDEDLPYLLGDEEKIRRVLSNLVDNALKFTPSGGSIILSGKREDSSILLEVSDNGPGIPAEYREEIFNPFVQVPGSTGKRLGTGLGLAFAKLAIEAHGGTIWVESGESGGSVFRIRLPVGGDREG
jgi:PAS domain S-box-containing protein